jgi:hypothetical protein
MEEVQSILMSLPPEVVVAGLDGEKILRYEAPKHECSEKEAQKAVYDIFKQAQVNGARLKVDQTSVRITFRAPNTENERYAYLKWHLGRVTGRAVIYEAPRPDGRQPSLIARLRSMLPSGGRIRDLAINRTKNYAKRLFRLAFR